MFELHVMETDRRKRQKMLLKNSTIPPNNLNAGIYKAYYFSASWKTLLVDIS